MNLFKNIAQTINEKERKNLARIIACYGSIYIIKTNQREKQAKVSGKFSYNTNQNSDYPVVGDYVIIQQNPQGDDIIIKVIKRASVFARKAIGDKTQAQIIGANIDYAFICMSLNNDYSLRRLERYITITWETGAVPVIVLTKADLCKDITPYLLEVESVALGVDIIITSRTQNSGLDALKQYLKPEKTACFLGSSGVGKSTLINHLLGTELIKTKEIRMSDDKGKHTTTTRNLFYLKNGSSVIDTPGMREIGVEFGDIDTTFSDITNLATMCRFSNCQHKSEPGCAVLQAIENGELDQKRFNNYKKLKIEMGYDGMNFKQLEKSKLERMFSSVGGIKGVKSIAKQRKNRSFEE